MRTAEQTSLTIASPNYELTNEQAARSQIEKALDDLRRDVVDNRDGANAPASRAFRRQQFLLMGG
jgi:hypothetical protein